MATKAFGVKELKIDGTGTPTIESPSGGNLNITAATATFSGNVSLNDGKKIRLGNTDGDFDVYFDDNTAVIETGSRPLKLDTGSSVIIGANTTNFATFEVNSGHLIHLHTSPGIDNTYDLGNIGHGAGAGTQYRWRSLYLSGSANAESLVSPNIDTTLGNLHLKSGKGYCRSGSFGGYGNSGSGNMGYLYVSAPAISTVGDYVPENGELIRVTISKTDKDTRTFVFEFNSTNTNNPGNGKCSLQSISDYGSLTSSTGTWAFSHVASSDGGHSSNFYTDANVYYGDPTNNSWVNTGDSGNNASIRIEIGTIVSIKSAVGIGTENVYDSQSTDRGALLAVAGIVTATKFYGTTGTFTTGVTIDSGGASAAGLTASNVKVGVSVGNQIDTVSGDLYLDSTDGTVIVEDDLKVNGSILADDNKWITLGSTNTVDIYYDGSGTKIEGTGGITIESSTSSITLKDSDGSLFATSSTGNISHKNLEPTTTAANLNLGSSTKEWKDLYLSGSANVGGTITGDGSGLTHLDLGNANNTGTIAAARLDTATTQSAGNNSTKIATTAYTDTAISNLVDSSPDALNTLNELAAALGDDANFSTTVTNSIATKLPLAGGTLDGDVRFNGSNTNNYLFWDKSEDLLSIVNGDVTISEDKKLTFAHATDATKKVEIQNTGAQFQINSTENIEISFEDHAYIMESLEIDGSATTRKRFGLPSTGAELYGDVGGTDGHTRSLVLETSGKQSNDSSTDTRKVDIYGDLTLSSGTITGNGSGLTNLPAGQLTGSLPAIDGSSLTGITASAATKVNIQEKNAGWNQVVFCSQNSTGNQDLYIDTNDDHLKYDPNAARLYSVNYTGGSGGLGGSGLSHFSSTTINRDGMTVGADQSADSPEFLSSNYVRLDANTGNIKSTGICTASYFYGDGSNITGLSVSSGDHISEGNTEVETIDTGSNGYIKFKTEGIERLRIKHDSTLLHVTTADAKGITQNATGDFYIKNIVNVDRSAAGASILALHGQWDDKDVAAIKFITGGDTVNKDDGHICFETSSENNIAERFRIRSDGKIACGTAINVTDSYEFSLRGADDTGALYAHGRNHYLSNRSDAYASLTLKKANEDSDGTDYLQLRDSANLSKFTILGDGTLKIIDTITHEGDDNTKIRFPSNDTISFETAGSERLRITSAGDIETSNLRVLDIVGDSSDIFMIRRFTAISSNTNTHTLYGTNEEQTGSYTATDGEILTFEFSENGKETRIFLFKYSSTYDYDATEKCSSGTTDGVDYGSATHFRFSKVAYGGYSRDWHTDARLYYSLSDATFRIKIIPKVVVKPELITDNIHTTGIGFLGSSDSYIKKESGSLAFLTNTFKIDTAGSERLRIDSSGRVLVNESIGTRYVITGAFNTSVEYVIGGTEAGMQVSNPQHTVRGSYIPKDGELIKFTFKQRHVSGTYYDTRTFIWEYDADATWPEAGKCTLTGITNYNELVSNDDTKRWTWHYTAQSGGYSTNFKDDGRNYYGNGDSDTPLKGSGLSIEVGETELSTFTGLLLEKTSGGDVDDIDSHKIGFKTQSGVISEIQAVSKGLGGPHGRGGDLVFRVKSNNVSAATERLRITETGIVRITGGQDADGLFEMFADNGDDNPDKWRWASKTDGSMKLQHYAQGGWADVINCFTKHTNTQHQTAFQAGSNGIRFDVNVGSLGGGVTAADVWNSYNADGQLHRTDGNSYLTIDDYFRIRHSGNVANHRFQFRTDDGGNASAKGSWNSNQTFDFAEMFEWSDGNPSGEDRIGHTVAVDGLTGKIKIAQDGDTVIGVVSGTAAFVGNSGSMEWHGSHLRDEWGRFQLELVKDADGNQLYTDVNNKHKKVTIVENPDWDKTKEYYTREDRKEWDTIGLLGQCYVRKTAVIPSTWIKLREIDSTKDFYLIK